MATLKTEFERPDGAAATEADAPWPRRPYAFDAVEASALGRPLPADALCLVQYAGEPADDDPRRVVVPLPSLDGPRAGELWRSSTPVRHGRRGRFRYAENADVVMLHLRLSEAELTVMEDAVRGCYEELDEVVTALGFPHLLRVWNYVDDINRGEGDAERYRQFCVGRFAAIARRRGFESQLSAASAIGSADGGFTLLALAARQPGLQVENPRQVSAFHYPRIYGQRSPSFSRATLVPWADGAELLVSGTASIVGHASVHIGDPVAQLEQTAVNLEVLRVQARGHASRTGGELRPQFYTLYLRHAEDLQKLLPAISQCFGDAPLQVLVGDICRRELLLEVEAIYRAMPEQAASVC